MICFLIVNYIQTRIFIFTGTHPTASIYRGAGVLGMTSGLGVLGVLVGQQDFNQLQQTCRPAHTKQQPINKPQKQSGPSFLTKSVTNLSQLENTKINPY